MSDGPGPVRALTCALQDIKGLSTACADMAMLLFVNTSRSYLFLSIYPVFHKVRLRLGSSVFSVRFLVFYSWYAHYMFYKARGAPFWTLLARLTVVGWSAWPRHSGQPRIFYFWCFGVSPSLSCWLVIWITFPGALIWRIGSSFCPVFLVFLNLNVLLLPTSLVVSSPCLRDLACLPGTDRRF